MPSLENPQHERFCNEFLVDFNLTKAAARAGFSEKSARTQGGRLMQNAVIAARVKELHAASLKSVNLDVQEILLELKRLAMCDLEQALNPIDGTLLPINEIPVDVRKCIAGFHVEEIWEGKEGQRVQIGVVKKIKFWDKNKALELLGKHFKMFTDKVEHSADSTLEALIVASMQAKESK